ncbi:unnamed protein product [Symbiodinium sp. CCMP2592]|nr:unnamed protein product [Symbiodinium sp. CCMP2592]
MAVPGSLAVPPCKETLQLGDSRESLGYDSALEDAQCPYPREKDHPGKSAEKSASDEDSQGKSPEKSARDEDSQGKSPEKSAAEDSPGKSPEKSATEDSRGKSPKKSATEDSRGKSPKKSTTAGPLVSGQKLKDLLKVHGSFKALEMQVRKINVASYAKSKGGRWVTKHYLTTVEHWTPPRTQHMDRHFIFKALSIYATMSFNVKLCNEEDGAGCLDMGGKHQELTTKLCSW